MRGAKQAAARVALDIGALLGKLGGIDGHHVAIAVGEEGGTAGRGRGGGALLAGGEGGNVGGRTADHCEGVRTADRCGGGGGANRCGSRFSLLREGPEAAVAAFLEAGDDLAQMDRLAGAAEQGAGDVQQDVDVVGHDDVGVGQHHWIMGGDALLQLLLDHCADRREHDAGCLGMTVGMADFSRDAAQQRALLPVHAHGDVVEACGCVVVAG